MTAMPPLRDILNNTPADAIDVDFNFNTVEAHLANEVINRDGSVAMTGPLTLSGPPTAPAHAVSKQYVDTSAIPVATIWQFAGASAPPGWALCDGASKTTTDPIYAALFAVIGYSYGGSGTNFNLPNLGGRVPVGRITGDPLFGTLGQLSGSRDATGVAAHTHALNHAHTASSGAVSSDHTHSIPSHSHTAVATGANDHAHTQHVTTMQDNPLGTSDYAIQTGGSYNMSANGGLQTSPAGAHGHDITVLGGGAGNTGGISANHTHGITVDAQNGQSGAASGGTPVNANIQPSIAINFIIRIG